MYALGGEIGLLLMLWNCTVYFLNGRLDLSGRGKRVRVRKFNTVQEEKMVPRTDWLTTAFAKNSPTVKISLWQI